MASFSYRYARKPSVSMSSSGPPLMTMSDRSSAMCTAFLSRSFLNSPMT
ncbi:hypothetical protein [Thermogymnomonas acidicola]|nr:hypothetical protein [Thermogymnomonas acidicola]